MDNRRILRFNSISYFNNRIWFVPGEYACLMSSEICESEMTSTVVVKLPGNRLMTHNSCGAINTIGNYTVIAPLWFNDFFVYDHLNKTIKPVKLCDILDKDEWEKSPNEICFSATTSFDNEVAFVGNKVPCVICFNDMGEISKTIDFSNASIRSSKLEFGHSVDKYNGRLFVPVKNEPGLIEINNDSKEYNILQLKGDYGYSAICCAKDKGFLFSNSSTDVDIIDMKTKRIIDKVILPNNFCSNNSGVAYRSPLVFGDYIWAFPGSSNMIIRIRINDGVAECVKQCKEDGYKYLNAGRLGKETIWAFSSIDNTFEVWGDDVVNKVKSTVWSPDNLENLWAKENITDYFDKTLLEDQWGLDKYINGILSY